MKKLLCLLFALCLVTFGACADAPLDRIDNYEITVVPREDGTVDITYHIEWTVLDSTSEGPLSWVKVGVPNYHVDEIASSSNAISSASYYADGGAYIRLDLNRDYEAGETVVLDFSIHQSYLFRPSGDSLEFIFTPGWFEEIAVSRITVAWFGAGAVHDNATGRDGDWLLWESGLAPGEKLDAHVLYDASYFPLAITENSYTDDYEEPMSPAEIFATATIIGVIAAAILLFLWLVNRYADPYAGYRGFTGGGTHIFIGGGTRIYSPGMSARGVRFGGEGNGAGRSSSGGCACACACACAGGGRAGCARKDFYGTKLDSRKIREFSSPKDR